ncbi:hypothetical protein [Microseira wollei]|uniref:hypothetical protein n=1 Tax=Microseira wollei TaxID=467598 RepID=UPI001CFC890E|nr:hypothetical protein [Microseira wollei]
MKQVIAVSGLEDGVLGTPLNADVGFLSWREESVEARICVDLWRRVSRKRYQSYLLLTQVASYIKRYW